MIHRRSASRFLSLTHLTQPIIASVMRISTTTVSRGSFCTGTLCRCLVTTIALVLLCGKTLLQQNDEGPVEQPTKHKSELRTSLLVKEILELESDSNSNDSSDPDISNSTSSPLDIAPSRETPPLESLIDGTTVKQDVSWMLDFAITGFAKCGTTFMMNFLRKNGRSNGELWVNPGEVHVMRKPEGPAKMVNLLYDEHAADSKAGNKRLYGIKNPSEMEIEGSLALYAKYFPKTRFIISLRHPVKWFESWFNFRQYHHFDEGLIIRPTSKLIGECEPGYPYKPPCTGSCPSGKMDVCTVRANFHYALSRLGKTPMTSEEEKQLLQHNMSIDAMPNKVFIMDSRQIIYNHPSAQNFTHDLQHFLGLESEFTPLKPYVPPADKYAEFSNKEAVEHLIHICDEEHDEVRKELVKIGKQAATWITEYFIESPDVAVSSKDEFIKLIEDYGHDPCDEETNSQ